MLNLWGILITHFMKTKILEKLKASVKSTNVSDQTFDEVAAFLALTVKEESQIEDAVKNAIPIINTFQGNINKVAADAVKNATPPAEPLKPQDQPNPTPASQGLTLADIEKLLVEKLNPLQEKVSGFEQKEKQTKLLSDVKAKLITENGFNEGLCDKIISKLQLTETSTVEDLAKNALSEYNDYSKFFGASGSGVGLPNGGQGAPADDALIDDVVGSLIR